MTDCGCTNFPASHGDVTIGANLGIGTMGPAARLHVEGVQQSALQHPVVVAANDPNGDSKALLVGINAGAPEALLTTGGAGPSPRLGLSVGGASALLVLSGQGTDGKVGIGTATPGALLDLSAGADTQLRLTDTRAVAADIGPGLEFYTSAIAGVIGKITTEKQDSSPSNSSFSLVFATKHDGETIAEQVRIQSNGFVGIGRPTPLSPLHVEKRNDGTYGARLHNTATDSAAHGLLVRVDQNTSSNVLLDVAAGTDPRLRVLGDGRVGIGTVTPGAWLEVSAAADAQLRLTDSRTAAVDIGPGIEFNATNGGGVIGKITTEKLNASSGNSSFSLAFSTKHDGVAIAERMRVQYDGNVGIGTTNPATRLHVQGALQQDALHYVMAVTGRSAVGDAKTLLIGIQAGTPEVLLTTGGVGAASRLAFSTGALAAQMVLTTNGHVGIGRTDPQSPLHVEKATDGGYGAQVYNTATGDTSKGLLVRVDQNKSGNILLDLQANADPRFQVLGNGRVLVPHVGAIIVGAISDTITDDSIWAAGDIVSKGEIRAEQSAHPDSGKVIAHRYYVGNRRIADENGSYYA